MVKARGLWKQIVIYITSFFLMIFLGWIIIHASGKVPMAKNIFQGSMYRIILPSVVIFIIAMSSVMKKSNMLSPHNLKVGIVVMGGLIVLIQLLYLYYIRVFVYYDNLLVLNEAVDMQTTGSIDPFFSNEYFLRYPHNYPMLILLYYVLHIGQILGITNTYWLIVIFGMCCMDTALIAGAGIIQKMYGLKHCFVYFAFCMLNPIIYIWIPWCYTTLSAMPFLMLSLYFALSAWKAENKKSQILYGFFFGIVVGFGIKIRVTTLIVIIALVICGFAWHVWKKGNIQLFFCASIVSVIVVLCTCSVIQNKYVNFDYEDKAFPATHFIMMGLGGEGTYKPEDVAFTQSYQGKQQKIEANIDEAINRLNNLGPKGFIKLMGRKLLITWQDGSCGFQDRWMHMLKPSDGYCYLIGEKNDLFLLYIQIYYVMNLILILVGTICSIAENKANFNILLRLTFLGIMMFYMLWEAQNHYSILVTFMLLILSIDGLTWIVRYRKKVAEKHGMRIEKTGCWVVVAALGVIVIALIYNPLFRQTIYYNDFSVRNLYSMGENLENIVDGEIVTQTFVTDRAFDTVYMPCGFDDNANAKGNCLIELIDENANIVGNCEVSGEQIATGQLLAVFDTIVPEKKEKYSIRISTEGVGKDNPIYLQRFNGALDIYPSGQLMRGGQEETGDLILSVFRNVEGNYL